MRDLIRAGVRALVGADPGPAPGPYEGHVIAVCASKGGVGKTTTAVHLAAGLATQQRRRVLLVDLDPQGHVGASLAASVPGRAGELAAVLTGSDRREVLDVAVRTGIPGLDFTAPDPGLAEADRSLTGRIGREFVLRRALRLTRTHYEYVVLDCPPNLGNLTLNALVAADFLVVPCDPSVLAFRGVEDLLRGVEAVDEQLGTRPALLGVLRTRVDRRNRTVHDAVETMLDRTYGTTLFRSEIGVSTSIARAQLAGVPVWAEAANSRGALDYNAFVEEVLERIEGPRRRN